MNKKELVEKLNELYIDNLDNINLQKSIDYLNSQYDEMKKTYNAKLNKIIDCIYKSPHILHGLCFKNKNKENTYYKILDIYNDANDSYVIKIKYIYVNTNTSISIKTSTVSQFIDLECIENIISIDKFDNEYNSTLEFLRYQK